MMKIIAAPLLSLSFLVSQAAEPEVRLAGIQSVIEDGADDFNGFRTFNSEVGVTIALIVRSGDKTLVGFDSDKATLKIGGKDTNSRFFGGNSFSEDRRAMRIEFATQGKPALSADGTLKIAGELPVTLATGREETRSEPFEVSDGTELRFPETATDMPTLKVKSSGKPQWGDDPFEIVLSTNRKADAFAGIRFLDKDGGEIEARRTSTSWMGFGNRGSGEIAHTFKAPHKELVLVLESWTGVEDKNLQVDLDAALVAP